jgi:hypothetical protein
VTPDPAVRKDGKCALAGCSKKRPITQADAKLQRRLRVYAGGQADADPFCSSRCCRRFHGTEVDGERGLADELIEAKSAAGRRGKSSWRGDRPPVDDPVLA